MTHQSNALLTGYRSIEETLRKPPAGARLLAASESGRAGDLARLARSFGVPVERVSRSELRRRGGENVRECALEVPPVRSDRSLTLSDLTSLDSESVLVLVLDHVTDPHNLGAILRSADQFRVDGVVIPDRRSADLTPAVLQASAGAAPHVPTARVKNIVAALEELKKAEFWVYGADMSGARADSTSLAGRTALVLGAEGAGLSRLVRERCDALIRIEGRGYADSFNVSVATGILLYEVRRQQRWFDAEI